MSQVKIQKLATGGTFIIDGQEISGDNAINAVRSYLGETTGGIMNALKDGATVDYNSGDNTIRITNSNGQSLTDNYLPAGTKASTMDSRFKKDWGATFHTKTDQFKRELAQLRGVNIGRFNNTEKPVDLKALTRGSGWFYTKDKDGNNQYIAGPENNNRMETIKSIRGYLEGDDDFRKGYKTDGWKQADIDALKNWVNNPTVSNDREGYWNGLFNRIQTEGGKNLTEADIQTLKLMGFDDSTITNALNTGNGQNDSNKPTIDKDWIGNREAAESAGIGIGKDSDGNWIITGDNPYTSDTWYARGLDFLRGTPFENGAIYNGRLYTQNDVFSGKYGDLEQAMNPFIGAWRDQNSDWNTRWNNALASGVKWYGMDNNIYANAGDPTKGYAQYWTRYFTDNNMNGNYNLIDTSNAFSNIGDRQIVSYIDGTNRNIYGIDEPVYLVRNSDGTITKYDNYDALVDAGFIPNSDRYGFAPKDITINPYQTIRGKDYAEYQRFGKNGQENTILVGRDGYLYLDRGDAKPKRIYDIEKLKTILAGQDFENKELDAITLRPNAFWTSLPFERNSFNFSQQKTNRQEKKNPTRFQWGGSIQKVKSSAISNDPSTKKHDYTKAHALDGSDGKLTDAEWMQIGAAAGDLAGVGISFVPGAGNILGATTGAAASTTKFIADIKQDGYQGKDLLHYLGNLGLDAATLIPGLGTGTKAIKAARIIKGVGKPLIKLLSITGAAAPVITAVNKIQNGEKYTSEDLTTAIRGIGAGIIAAKSMKDTIGEARLAKSVATKAEESGKSILNTVKSAEVDGIKLERSINDINKFVEANPTEGKAVESIKNILKTQGSEVTDVQAKSLLEGLGIKFDKGKLKLSRKAGIKKGFTTRGENITSFESPELPTAHSTFRYMVNPFARSKVLGSEAVFGFGNKAGLVNGNITANEVNAAIKAPKATLEQQALMRMTAENPQAFGNLFKVGEDFVPINTKAGWYFGGNRYYRKAPILSQAEPVKVNYGNSFGKYLPVLYKSQPEILTPEVVVPQGSFFTRRLELPQGFVPRGLLGQRNPQINPLYGPGVIKYSAPKKQTNGFVVYGPTNTSFTFKKGGKIIKAQTGLRSRENWLQKNNVLSSGDLHTILNNEIAHPKNNTVNAYNSVTNSTTTYQGPSIKQNYLNNNLQYKADTGDQNRGGFWGNEGLLNKPNIDDAIRAGISARAIYHDRDLQRIALGKLYQRQFQTPQFDRAKYNYSDIEQGYNESVKPLLERKFVTSDAAYALSDKHQTAQQLSGLAGQKNAQLSQRFNQTGDIDRQIDAQNETNRIQTANEKSQYLTNLNYQDAMLDSVIWNRLFSDVINPFGQQMSQQGRDAWNKNLGMNYQFDAQNAQRVENARIQGDLNREFMPAWNALSNAEKKQYGDLETYVYTTNPERYKEIVNGNPIYRNTMQNIMRKYSRGIGAGMLYYKSGGSTVNIKSTNKNQRSAQEQIAINGHKAAKRSVDELSKALLSMLKQLQAMK